MAEYWVIQGRVVRVLQRSSYRTPGHLCTRLNDAREEKAAEEEEQKEAARAIQQIDALSVSLVCSWRRFTILTQVVMLSMIWQPGKCVTREEAYNTVQVSSNFKCWKAISDKIVSSSKGSRVLEKLDPAKSEDAPAPGSVVSGSSNLRRE
ncbi:uncharacterized protein LOC115680748 [Syzygium oleosum]|uniref:uncharacterized protein LOC115680748 n=1 Tax=Syzygium oleosum TaxID=219896 RepID=UPI0024BA7BC1|nr:uncharacterized protein LOC115680748 [Syzygium oleosum]